MVFNGGLFVLDLVKVLDEEMVKFGFEILNIVYLE